MGEAERAKEWAERALLLDPDNMNLRYNFACSLITDLHDFEAALDLLGPRFETMPIEVLNWVRTDPDLDPSATIRASRQCWRPRKRASHRD
jgi:adenylate cyclase